MPIPPQPRPHGYGARGLPSLGQQRPLAAQLLARVESPDGRYGRLFKLEPATFPDGDLWALAQAMTRTLEQPQDGATAQESHIPAAYTYFAQFIDHDQTFDPSTFQQQRHDAEGIIDFRTPRLDLDNVFGRGPADQPYLYDGQHFLLGEELRRVLRNTAARDLPRAAANAAGVRRAIIGDARNDENVIVSQLHGMFLAFHNRLVDQNPRLTFEEVQQLVRWHYQWVIVHDLLPRLIHQSVLDAVSPAICDPKLSFAKYPPNLKYYRSYKSYLGEPEAFMPLEYSAAAYRLGHSMVRPSYRVNEHVPPLRIVDAKNPSQGLNAFRDFPREWTVDWHRFIDLDTPPRQGNTDRIQYAYKIDTSVVDPLGALLPSIADDEGNQRLRNLPYRSLLRGTLLQLPSGQNVARAMGLVPLPDEAILIGSADDGTGETDGARPLTELSRNFVGRCPLWVYVLAEARRNFYEHGRAQLGPVGGRIVGEVMLGLLVQDPTSFLRDPGWSPPGRFERAFSLADLLAMVLNA